MNLVMRKWKTRKRSIKVKEFEVPVYCQTHDQDQELHKTATKRQQGQCQRQNSLDHIQEVEGQNLRQEKENPGHIQVQEAGHDQGLKPEPDLDREHGNQGQGRDQGLD